MKEPYYRNQKKSEKQDMPGRMPRRSFVKLGVTGIGLLAALQFGTAATFLPGIARAEEKEVKGRKLNVVRLEKPLAELDKETAKYRDCETLPTPENKMVYSNDVRVPGEVTFLVTLELKKDERRLSVAFPKEKEKDPDSKGAGIRGTDLNDFAELVKKVSGKEMERVMFILEKGTFEYEGKDTQYITAYIFPLDSHGNMITKNGNEYLVYNSSQYADVVGGDPAIIIDPSPNEQKKVARK